jgi:hypothetical protein
MEEGINGAGRPQDGDHSADQEDEEDDFLRRLEPLGNRAQKVPRPE